MRTPQDESFFFFAKLVNKAMLLHVFADVL